MYTGNPDSRCIAKSCTYKYKTKMYTGNPDTRPILHIVRSTVYSVTLQMYKTLNLFNLNVSFTIINCRKLILQKSINVVAKNERKV